MHIEHLKYTLDTTLSFIEKADSKANIQLAVCGVMLIAVAAAGETEGALNIAFLVLSVGSLSISMVLDLFCVYPRLAPKRCVASKIYFDTANNIEQLQPGSIKEYLIKATEDDIAGQIVDQIVENNRVAAAKYKIVNKSSTALIVGVTTTSLYFLIRIQGIIQ